MKQLAPDYVLPRNPEQAQARGPAPDLVNPAYGWDPTGVHTRKPGVGAGLDGTRRGALLLIDLNQVGSRKQALQMFRQLSAAVLADAGALEPIPAAVVDQSESAPNAIRGKAKK